MGQLENNKLTQLRERVELLENALALVAWHAVAYSSRDDDNPVCMACMASDTKHDNCPVIGVVERLECPFPEEGEGEGEGFDPLSPVVTALYAPTYISRLTEDIPSVTKPGHIHVAGTEFAPVRRVGHDKRWEIEIRVPEGDGSYWYETMVVDLGQTEVGLELRDIKSE